MGLRPMISSLLRNKTGPLLVALQIAVTLAIVINATFIIAQRIEKMNRDTGIDVDNVIAVYTRGFGADFDVQGSVTNDVALLESIPGVIAATVANHVPLSGSGSGTGLRTVPDETVEPVGTARYEWSEKGLEALGVELISGRNFFAEEVDFIRPDTESVTPPSVLVTRELAEDLFGDEDALGKTIYWGDMKPSTIVGIIGHMHGSWVNWDKLANVVVQPGKPLYTANRYIVRVEPGLRDSLIPVIEKELGESNRRRIVKSVSPLRYTSISFRSPRRRSSITPASHASTGSPVKRRV